MENIFNKEKTNNQVIEELKLISFVQVLFCTILSFTHIPSVTMVEGNTLGFKLLVLVLILSCFNEICCSVCQFPWDFFFCGMGSASLNTVCCKVLRIFYSGKGNSVERDCSSIVYQRKIKKN